MRNPERLLNVALRSYREPATAQAIDLGSEPGEERAGAGGQDGNARMVSLRIERQPCSLLKYVESQTARSY